MEAVMILITGGGGFIGLNLARDLVDRGQNVLLIRRHDFAVPSFLSPCVGKQVTIARGDIGELPVLYSTI
jgi:nucleoside-diphosphate-sugar epimerase